MNGKRPPAAQDASGVSDMGLFEADDGGAHSEFFDFRDPQNRITAAQDARPAEEADAEEEPCVDFSLGALTPSIGVAAPKPPVEEPEAVEPETAAEPDDEEAVPFEGWALNAHNPDISAAAVSSDRDTPYNGDVTGECG